jgi:PDGLE domain-containing protein
MSTEAPADARRKLWTIVTLGLVVALLLAFFVSRFASGSPDGLNKVASDQGFAQHQKPHALDDSPLAGYAVRGVHDEGLSTGLAGVIGVTLTFLIGAGLFALMKWRRSKETKHTSGGP